MRGGRSGSLLAQHHMVYAVQAILASQHQQAGAEAFAGCIEASPVLVVKCGDLPANLLVQLMTLDVQIFDDPAIFLLI